MKLSGDNQETGPLEIDEAAGRLASLISSDDEDEDDNSEELADGSDSADDDVESDEDEDDAEGEADTDAEEDGEGQEQQPAGQLFTVKVDGEEIQVGLDELQAGYQRQADYTRKAMQLADNRRAFETEVQQVRVDRQRYAEGLNVLQQYLQQQAPQEPDPSLRIADPVEYASQWAQYQQHRDRAGQIAQQQRILSEQQQLDDQERLKAHVLSERDKLTKAIPRWQDASKAEADKNALLEFGKRIGFSQADLDTVYDHRAVKVLWMAHQYEQMLANRQKLSGQVKQKAQKPVTAPPGSARATEKTPVYSKALQRLRKTGSERDAAAAIFSLLR